MIMMHKFARNFFTCGLVGWCMEILFTSVNSLRRREFRLKGSTSVWMFPIYGSAALLAPVCRLLKNAPVLIRGTAYMSLIFSAEFLTGKLLSKKGICPWDYSRSRWNIGRVVRLDYAPNWFGAGLLFEKILLHQDARRKVSG